MYNWVSIGFGTLTSIGSLVAVWLGEELIKETLKNYLIIRTTWVYGPEITGKNFALSLIRRMKNGEKVRVPFDQISSPTYSNNLSEIIEELIKKDKSGTHTVVGSELTDRYSFAKKICDVFELSKDMLIPTPTQELGQKAKRSFNGEIKDRQNKKRT